LLRRIRELHLNNCEAGGTRRAAGADVRLVHCSDAGQYTRPFAQVLDDHDVSA